MNQSSRPHTVVCEHYQQGRWVETARAPVSHIPMRRADDVQRYLESLSALAGLLVRSTHVDEESLRLRVLNDLGTVIAVVRGDGSITITSEGTDR